MKGGLITLACAVILLVFHPVIEHLLHIPLTVGMAALLISMAGPQLAQLTAMSAAGATATAPPAAMMALLGKLLPMYAVLMSVSLVFYAVMFGAMNRAVLAPGDSAFGYLRVGAQELRQFAVLLIFGVLGLVVYFVTIMVLAILLGIVGGVLAAVAHIGPEALPAIILPVLVVAVLSLFLFLGARLCLAPAQTFATGRVNPFGSWALTRGKVWPILGVYGLAWLIALVIFAALMVITVAAVAVVDVKGEAAFFLNPDMSSLGAYFSPARIVNLAVGAIASALIWPLLLMPGAEIYRRLAVGGSAAEVFA